ncbi:hypothetical protein EVAR_75120_1 [Eumeta japonica]|uniref:Uncharacterized protein n=1 Tax=Eumeta variegata TaxID=151549 RepID=A0A4C1U0V2_EUMVA|nr:hypothetical protein EVAR_75120_1 [Eumeta japonica]
MWKAFLVLAAASAALAAGGHAPRAGLALPKTSFGLRDYKRAIAAAVGALHRSRSRLALQFARAYNFTVSDVHLQMFPLTPSPTGSGSRADLPAPRCRVLACNRTPAAVSAARPAHTPPNRLRRFDCMTSLISVFIALFVLFYINFDYILKVEYLYVAVAHTM